MQLRLVLTMNNAVDFACFCVQECNSVSKKLKGLQDEHGKQQRAFERFQDREALLKEVSSGV